MKKPQLSDEAKQEAWSIGCGIPMGLMLFLFIAWGCTQSACFG